MKKLCLAALALAGVLAAGQSPLVHEARAAQSETERSRIARLDALKVARQINMAEAAERRFGGAYVPFERLANVAAVPPGFRLRLVTDGRGYIFTLKNDTAGYTIVSDDSGTVYEAVAIRGGGLVPIETF
jgi:hypothetical protein